MNCKCPCGCEDNQIEIYPFICPKCKGFYDCDVVIDGLCICPSCEEEKYELHMSFMRKGKNELQSLQEKNQ